MEEITIVLTDETKRRINEMLVEEREKSDYYYSGELLDDEQTYWAN